MKYHVGCAGYNYQQWKGKFYPQDLPTSKWLTFYAEHFNTVEINASFYKFPTEKSLKKWYDSTPDDFTFSIKAHQIITHTKRFKDAQEQVNSFYKVAAEGLGKKLKCILFQLPPSFKYTEENLENILQSLDSNYNNVIEFRNESWWNKDVYKKLKANKITFCTVSFPKLPDDLIKTSDSAYIRFHGKELLYKSSYSEKEIQRWIDLIKNEKFKNAYIYFNNTWLTAAIENALLLKQKLL